MKTPAALSAALAVATLAVAAAERPIPPAFGPHVNLQPGDFANSVSFNATQRIVGTYYFYWYDAASKAHIIDGDGTDALTTHPPTLENFSWKSATWHRRQLEDMIAAGIDVVLPVFWGAPSEQTAKANLHWSYEGIPKLIEARETLLREGKSPPRIGMFYDTSTLQNNQWHEHIDLTTDYGRQWFYATVRDFFSMVPARHWAMIEGKPVVLLYSAAFAKKHDQSVIDFTRAEFAREFGGRMPWIAREVSWHVKADNTVAWGGALGLKNPGVASIGPGYDHSAVPGRTPLVMDRRGGRFYEENWLKFLRRPTTFVMVETWNEFHEGTDVAESREYGRRFIELTRKYSDLFKSGWKPALAEGKFSQAASVRIALGSKNNEGGLVQIDNSDGATVATNAAGKEARTVISPGSRYLYFAVDDSFKAAGTEKLVVEVEFLDAAAGRLALEFDGSDTSAPFNGAYSRSPDLVKLTGAGRWITTQFRLPGAQLANGQNLGADFRLVIEAPGIAFGTVTLRRR